MAHPGLVDAFRAAGSIERFTCRYCRKYLSSDHDLYRTYLDRPRDADGSRRTLLAFPAGKIQKRLVLMADEFDHFRSVCHDPLKDSHAERLGICLRIVDREFDVQHSVIQTPESFG